jgi:hypothetical protein
MVLDLLQRVLPAQNLADVHIRSQTLVIELWELVGALSSVTMKPSTPWSTMPGLGEPLSRRCGPSAWKPSHRDADNSSDDLNQMFLPQMHLPLAALQNGGRGRGSVLFTSSVRFIWLSSALYLQMRPRVL